MLIGVTGGIGAGKSAVCGFFAEWGAAVIDADRLGHQALDEAEVRRALRAAFGAGILRADGQVDRGALGELAFASNENWCALQRIVRPALARRLWQAAVRAQSRHRIVVVDAALLFEWNAACRFDRIVLVQASERLRVRRVQRRTQLAAAQVRRRMRFQVGPEQALAQAHFVITNEGDLDELRAQAERVWSALVEAGERVVGPPPPMEARRVAAMSELGFALKHPDRFADRHLGPRRAEIAAMLAALGAESLAGLIEKAVPEAIRQRVPLGLASGWSEADTLQELRAMARRNRPARSFIGMGYADCITPPVIQRHILESPDWYTPYTPYQAEVAQGRLEALLNFQTMVAELTAMELANASLLDEATAAAEAVAMLAALRPGAARRRFLVSSACHPQTVAVLRTRSRWRDWEVVVAEACFPEPEDDVFGVLLQYPATDGCVAAEHAAYVERAHAAGVRVAVAADLLALCLLAPPGEWGADVVVGSTQRFGMPMGCGGPHAAYLATRAEFRRHVPGRIVGVSVDAQGNAALRLALQTREQHIRREKATSNICTAQVLPAVVASMYAVYHGPEGLRRIARRVHLCARLVAAGAARLGLEVVHPHFFDTVRLRPGRGALAGIRARARRARLNLRWLADGDLCIALDEATTSGDVARLLAVLAPTGRTDFALADLGVEPEALAWPPACTRVTGYLTHEVFSAYHAETEMMRYIHRLQRRDLSLTSAMIPLGSCTMKLNGAAAMQPITWPEFGRVHPYAPADQLEGYEQLFAELGGMIAQLTGLPAVSLQPNSGAQGELTGLLAIRAYHAARGQGRRDVCLIPASAHGTNPASAALAGMNVIVVACDAQGSIDLDDLRDKAARHAERLGAFMVTYPSTHGVFEEGIVDACAIAHQHGAQVYLDGANMNALVGVCRPADLGIDVCHLNLHKTFAIPHGGGGPGMGPIAAAAHLAPYLPQHPLAVVDEGQLGAVAAAPWGSALVLLISWAYLKLMGSDGLLQATQVAILNANYIAHRLETHYPVLYRGRGGLVAHEVILDLRLLKQSAGVTVEDVAKRLMDYGFHAPTISFPVPGTLMVEPTESESLAELDRFCDAMIAIRGEVAQIEGGEVALADSPLRHAPHTAALVCGKGWTLPYSRQRAAMPAPWLAQAKFWPAVGRIDNAQGDRQLVCVRPAALSSR